MTERGIGHLLIFSHRGRLSGGCLEDTVLALCDLSYMCHISQPLMVDQSSLIKSIGWPRRLVYVTHGLSIRVRIKPGLGAQPPAVSRQPRYELRGACIPSKGWYFLSLHALPHSG